MIHYSTIPIDQVYAGWDSFTPNYQEINYQGVTMLIEPQGTQGGRIVRLISPNPQDYLNPNWAPGQFIRY